MMIFQITNKQKVENYILNLGKNPFTAGIVSNETAVNYHTVYNVLRSLEIQGKIKQIGKEKLPRIFIKVTTREPQAEVSETLKNNVLAYIRRCGYTSLRNLAKNLNISAETVRQAMISAGIPRENPEAKEKFARKQAGKKLIFVIKRIRKQKYDKIRRRIL